MSRDYSKVSPRFWTGQTGRRIKAEGSDCVVVALYLMTSPGSNMIGLYYLPLITLAHETGLTIEGASKALARLSDAGFAEYDADNEEVWVPEMAAYQIAPTLEPTDKRVTGLARELHGYRKSRFFAAFMERYREAFSLPDIKPISLPIEAPSKPLARPIEGAFSPHRSQDQDQEQDQEQEQEASATLFESPRVPRFDFEAVYARYPRKEGKAEGMKSAKARIKTQADFDRFAAAVDGYADLVRREGRTAILLWSTFCNGRWTDYEPGAPALQFTAPPNGTTPAAPVRASANPLPRYSRPEEA